jgi:hypothetical protein
MSGTLYENLSRLIVLAILNHHKCVLDSNCTATIQKEHIVAFSRQQCVLECPQQILLRESASILSYTYTDGGFSILRVTAKCTIIKTYIFFIISIQVLLLLPPESLLCTASYTHR